MGDMNNVQEKLLIIKFDLTFIFSILDILDLLFEYYQVKIFI